MKYEQAVQALKENGMQKMAEIYGEACAAENLKRYEDLAEGYKNYFADEPFEFFSAPGRTEISGNHTDHNSGKILAGSIHLDTIAAAGKNNSDQIRMISATYHQDMTISLDDLERTSATSGTGPLLKGILDGFKKHGHKIGGFDVYTTTNVIGAAGVSSSASFEMLICTIVNYLFNDGKLDISEYAQIGKYAENNFWNKQSGLLDQMACAAGGIVTIDFKDQANPVLEKLAFDFDELGHDLVIVNTGKGHADLSEEYSSVPIEMKKVAQYFGKEVLRECTLDEVIDNMTEVRKFAGDRAALRAIHFLTEDDRVDVAVKAIKEKDYASFLNVITESGNSSWKYLQNCYPAGEHKEQPVTVALALTEVYLKKLGRGVCRVHGGGFAGVIMALVPHDDTDGYVSYMEKHMGKENVYKMRIRNEGAIRVEF